MITYDEALKIAKGLKKNIDACVEFENAYCFKSKSEEYDIGGNGPCIVLKENGRAIISTEYYTNYATGIIKEYDI